MTTSIDITSDQFAKDTTFRTADGKTIRVKHFCVEESTKISLKDLKVGQKARTKSDEIITFVKFFDDGRDWSYQFKRVNEDTFSFCEDGSYYSERTPSENDIVEILPFERPSIDLNGLVPGQKVRTFKGEVLTYVKRGYAQTWPYYFCTESGESRTFTPAGIYSHDLIPTDSDIAEILPYEAPRVSLGDLPISSTFRTRGGLVCKLEKSNTPELGLFFGRPPNTDPAGLFYDADGSCRKGSSYDAVEVITRAEPRVSIEDAVKGDQFLIRDGRTYTYTGEKSSGIFRTKDSGGQRGLNFKSDGSAYGLEEYADVVKIIPASKACTNGAKVGDKFVLRNGREYVCTGKISPFSHNIQGHCKELFDDAYLYFRPDGSCPNRDQSYDVIEFIQVAQRPRVSIEGARKGDKLVIRDGRVYTCTGERVEKGRFRTTDKDGSSGLTFDPDGRAPGLRDYADVVEIIPAPKPTLEKRIARQLRQCDGPISEILVSFSDWDALPKEFRDGGKSYFNGVRLLRDEDIHDGDFNLFFKAD